METFRDVHEKTANELLREWDEVCETLGTLAWLGQRNEELEIKARVLVHEMQFRGIDFE